MARRYISIVHWFPELEKHKCGYCKQTDTNCSHGMWAESLTVEDYQYLIDRGWRRSGKYCYKPVMDITCCPLYTIRCEALNFKLSKSQKKIIKRINRFLSDSVTEKLSTDVNMVSDNIEEIQCNKPIKNIDVSKIETEQIDLMINQRHEIDLLEVEDHEPVHKSVDKKMSSSSSSISNNEVKPGAGADPNKPPCKKAKLIRLEKKQKKFAAKGLSVPVKNVSKVQEKTFEEFINEVSADPSHRLKVSLVVTSGYDRDWTQIRSQEYEIYRKYQIKIHGDPPEKCTEKQFTSFLLESPLQVKMHITEKEGKIVLKQMNPLEPTYKISAQLFMKYQMFVHNELSSECDINNFKEFLVDSPLEHVETPGGPPSGYGSFHQQYWLDDKLIAVGVIDILPKCVSSVYFFYDPDYRNLTLGTYGSLRELYFVRELHNTVAEIKYYYMGFYIHSCPKMRYKANLYPSYLLCPETYTWFPMDHCIPKLDKAKYCRFHDDPNAVDKDSCNLPTDLDQLMILIGYNGCVPYKYLKSRIRYQDELENYFLFGKLVGKKCIPRLLVVLQNADF